MLLVLLAVITPMLLVIILCLVMRCCRSVNNNTGSPHQDKYAKEKLPSIAIIPQAKNLLTHSPSPSQRSSQCHFYIHPERAVYLNDLTKCSVNHGDNCNNRYHEQTTAHDDDEEEAKSRKFVHHVSRSTFNEHSLRPLECDHSPGALGEYICQREVLLSTRDEYSHANCNPLARIPCHRTSPNISNCARWVNCIHDAHSYTSHHTRTTFA